MTDRRLMGALAHVSRARKSLSLAASDLAVVRYCGALPSGETAEELSLELERVCDLAQELERCSANLGEVAGGRHAADLREVAGAHG